MKRLRSAVACALIVASVSLLRADVRTDEKTRIQFAGMLGRIVNIFGGKAAREGVVTTVAVKGDRKASTNDQTGEIIDLGEEKIYNLDIRKKTYKVTTFAELRRQMEEAQKKADEQAQKEEPQQKSAEPPKDEKQLDFDIDVKQTGERKTINGFDTKEVILTITIREKGKKVEDSGGLITTADTWLTSKIAAMQEITDFDIRYAQKLYGPMLAGVSADQMAAAMRMYPLMKPSLTRLNPELEKLDGTPILTTLTLDAVQSKADYDAAVKQREQQQAQDQADNTNSAARGNIGGLLGGLAKKAAAKKVAGGDDEPKQRATFMTSTNEVLKVATSVSPTDVAIPAGFKETK